MKGIIFTEFLALVEEKFGYEVVDKILASSKTQNDGSYTSVGTYDHNELIDLVVALSSEVDADTSDLVKAFGGYLFQNFVKGYSETIAQFHSAFDLLEQVEGYIHVEVRKLYPGAELPTFSHVRHGEDTLEIVYNSKRPFADLCEGLMTECISHFDESIQLQRIDLVDDGTSAKFLLKKIKA